MYVFFLVWTALILQLLPPAVPISSPGSLVREVGQNVIFMLNGTAMLEATWGVRDGNTNYLNPRLIRVFNPGGVFQDTKLNSTSYAGRVSFVGNLTRGQAWFKITNLIISDTNIYLVKIIAKGQSTYQNIPIQLTVTQPATTAPATNPLQTTTRSTVSSLPSHSLPTTSSVSGPSNRTILIRLVKERFKDLSDVNSAAFKKFSESFVSEINIAYGSADTFRQAKVRSLREDSIPVKFVLYFEDKVNPRQVCAPLEKAIKDNRLGRFKVVPGSLECYTEPTSSTPKNQSSCECAYTTIIAVCVTAIVLLILVITFLLIYIWRGKVTAEKCAKSTRRSSKLKEKELGAYENAQIRVESVSGARSTELAQTLTSGKELYETIKENKHEGTISGTRTSRRPPANTQGYLSSLPKHYQQLRRETPQPIPLYEPLDQRNIGDTETESTGDTKTYEQLQQNKPGKEYQLLKKYANVESKV